MKNMIFILASIGLLMLTGCGEEGSTETTTSASSAPSSSVPAPQEVASLPSIPPIPGG